MQARVRREEEEREARDVEDFRRRVAEDEAKDAEAQVARARAMREYKGEIEMLQEHKRRLFEEQREMEARALAEAEAKDAFRKRVVEAARK